MANQITMSRSAFETFLRHYERLYELSVPRCRNIKTMEAFRLSGKDIVKLKRMKGGKR